MSWPDRSNSTFLKNCLAASARRICCPDRMTIAIGVGRSWLLLYFEDELLAIDVRPSSREGIRRLELAAQLLDDGSQPLQRNALATVLAEVAELYELAPGHQSTPVGSSGSPAGSARPPAVAVEPRPRPIRPQPQEAGRLRHPVDGRSRIESDFVTGASCLARSR